MARPRDGKVPRRARKHPQSAQAPPLPALGTCAAVRLTAWLASTRGARGGRACVSAAEGGPHVALVVHDPGREPVVRRRGRGGRHGPAVGQRLARAAVVHHLAAHLARLRVHPVALRARAAVCAQGGARGAACEEWCARQRRPWGLPRPRLARRGAGPCCSRPRRRTLRSLPRRVRRKHTAHSSGGASSSRGGSGAHSCAVCGYWPGRARRSSASCAAASATFALRRCPMRHLCAQATVRSGRQATSKQAGDFQARQQLHTARCPGCPFSCPSGTRTRQRALCCGRRGRTSAAGGAR